MAVSSYFCTNITHNNKHTQLAMGVLYDVTSPPAGASSKSSLRCRQIKICSHSAAVIAKP